MTRFGRELEAALAPTDVLARIAETVGRAVNSRAVRVSTTLASGEILVGAVAARRAGATSADAPFDSSCRCFRTARLSPRSPWRGSSCPERRLAMLQHIAAVSAGALRNFRLLAELESLHETIERQNAEIAASRARLSAAAEAERRRLQRVVAHRSARTWTSCEPRCRPCAVISTSDRTPWSPSASAWPHVPLTSSTSCANCRAASIRPILVDHGLAAALRAMLRRLELPVELDVAASVAGSRYAAAVETTVYLCCQAALEMAAAQHNRSTACGAAIVARQRFAGVLVVARR